MVSIYKKLNNVPTHLMIWDNVFDNKGEDVILCVTGNPGVPDFYIEFASKLYEKTKIPVCVIGHAGNEFIPERCCHKMDENMDHKFGLRGQVEHKMDLVRSISENSKIHLIGHSIGAWVALEMLEANIDILPRIKTINLLFPTIEKMATTKNGFYLNLCRPFHYLILLNVFMFHLLPRFIKIFLIQLYLIANSLPDYLDKRILKLTFPGALNRILNLAYEEMDYVDELNTEILDTVKRITNVIYTKKDSWVPSHFSEDISRFKPEISIREVDADHSFVFLSSEPIAELVSEFILSKNKNKDNKQMLGTN